MVDVYEALFDEVIIEIADGRHPVATITLSRASGRVRRAAARGESRQALAELTTTRRIDTARIGAAVLPDDSDLAAELGRWARPTSTPRPPTDQASSG